MKFILFLFLISQLAFSQTGKSLYLSAEDQKYYKNDSFEGNNQRERIDSNVKEINKLHGEIAALKSEVQNLKKDIEELKKGK